jgi:subtilisin family serine protease
MITRFGCLAAFLISLAACAPTQNAAPNAPLSALRARAQEMGAVRVIVRIVDGAPMPQMQSQALATFAAAGVEDAEPVSERLPYIVAEVTPQELDRLYPNPQFSAWSEDRLAFPTLAESGPLVQAPQLWELGARGAGQGVAILDTGVDAAHPFLAGRVVVEACFSTTSAANRSTTACPNGEAEQTGAGAARPCAASGCEHGTHVAGIAAGRGETFSGMAPDADIIAIQVFSVFRGAACGGGGPCVASFTSDQIRALDFLLQLAEERRIASANMSLGGGRSQEACDDDVTKPVIDQLRAAGVATVIASGNDSFADAVSFPGCISTAVTVGATNDRDEVAPFSNRGPQVDLHAPGVAITSSIPGGRFAPFSGTSMATPHVAGAFAALRSHRPDASVDQIEEALEATGLAAGGRPRIRLFDAAGALPDASIAAAAQTPAAGDTMRAALAELAALPQDRPVRLIVGAAAPTGADDAARAAAVLRAEVAAHGAGASYVGRMGGQSMLVIEATPAQARALVNSGAIASLQIDRTARPQ